MSDYFEQKTKPRSTYVQLDKQHLLIWNAQLKHFEANVVKCRKKCGKKFQESSTNTFEGRCILWDVSANPSLHKRFVMSSRGDVMSSEKEEEKKLI